MAGPPNPPIMINGDSSAAKPIQLAVQMPYAPDSRIHLHLTILTTSIVLFVTSTNHESSGAGASLGSFVYAMPDRYNPSQPLCTALYPVSSSLDFTTRLAKVLVRKTQRAVHVGSSASFTGAAGGGTVEEEMEGFKRIVEVVVKEIENARLG